MFFVGGCRQKVARSPTAWSYSTKRGANLCWGARPNSWTSQCLGDLVSLTGCVSAVWRAAGVGTQDEIFVDLQITCLENIKIQKITYFLESVKMPNHVFRLSNGFLKLRKNFIDGSSWWSWFPQWRNSVMHTDSPRNFDRTISSNACVLRNEHYWSRKPTGGKMPFVASTAVSDHIVKNEIVHLFAR